MTQSGVEMVGGGHPYAGLAGHVIWILQVDWDRDGDFGSASEPQSIRQVQVTRGRTRRVRPDGGGQQQPSAEHFRIEVHDPAGRYDGFNQDGPLYEFLGVSGQAVRLLLVSTSGDAPAEPVFTGTLRQVEYHAATRAAVLSGEGLARWLMSGPAESLWTACQPVLPGSAWDAYFVQDGSTPFPVNYWRGRPGGLPLRECVALTLARAGWPFGAYYGEGIHNNEQPDYFYFDGSSAWHTLEELADGFAARLFQLRDGRLFVMDRSDVSGLDASAPIPARAQSAQGLERPGPADGLRNIARVNVRPHSVTPFKSPYLAEYYVEAWSNPGPLEIAPLTSLEIDVKYPGGVGSAGVGSFVDVNGSGYPVNFECWSAADRSGTRMDAAGTGDGEFALVWESIEGNSVPYGNNQQWARVRFRNFSATQTAYFFDARLMLIGIREPGQPVVSQALDADSLALNGARSLTINSRWVQTPGMGAAIAQAYLDALSAREKAAPASLTYQWSGDLLYQNLLRYDLGTHVNFGAASPDNFGMRGRWLVVGQEINWLSADGQAAFVKLTFEKAVDVVAVVHERSSAVASGATPLEVLSVAHQVDDRPGRLLVALVCLRAYQSVSAVTFGGQAFTRHAWAQAGTGNDPRAELWYLPAPAVGTANVTVTLSGADFVEVGVVGFYHAHQSTPLGPALTAAQLSGAPAASLPAAEGDLVLDVLSYSGSNAVIGAGRALIGTLTSDGNWKLSASKAPGAASVLLDWSLSGAWAQVAVAVKAASG